MRIRQQVGGPALVWLAVAVLAGCAAEQPPETAPDAIATALDGISRDQLLACAGTPDRLRTVAGREVLVYERGSTVRGDPDFGVGIGAGVGSSSGVGLGAGMSASVPFGSGPTSDLCEVTVTLVDGAVADVRYRAESGFGSSRYRRCREITRRCLPSG